MTVRPARPDDVPALLRLIRHLAEYQRSADRVEATVESLRAALFGEQPTAHAHVVEHVGVGAREVVGFALWFRNFSTWTGKPGIYLEDLFVEPDQRGRGYGVALLRELARACLEYGYPRLEWSVLDWNVDAIGFYRSLGAVVMDESTVHRLTGEALRELAAGAATVEGTHPVR